MPRPARPRARPAAPMTPSLRSLRAPARSGPSPCFCLSRSRRRRALAPALAPASGAARPRPGGARGGGGAGAGRPAGARAPSRPRAAAACSRRRAAFFVLRRPLVHEPPARLRRRAALPRHGAQPVARGRPRPARQLRAGRLAGRHPGPDAARTTAPRGRTGGRSRPTAPACPCCWPFPIAAFGRRGLRGRAGPARGLADRGGAGAGPARHRRRERPRPSPGRRRPGLRWRPTPFTSTPRCLPRWPWPSACVSSQREASAPRGLRGGPRRLVPARGSTSRWRRPPPPSASSGLVLLRGRARAVFVATAAGHGRRLRRPTTCTSSARRRPWPSTAACRRMPRARRCAPPSACSSTAPSASSPSRPSSCSPWPGSRPSPGVAFAGLGLARPARGPGRPPAGPALADVVGRAVPARALPGAARAHRWPWPSRCARPGPTRGLAALAHGPPRRRRRPRASRRLRSRPAAPAQPGEHRAPALGGPRRRGFARRATCRPSPDRTRPSGGWPPCGWPRSLALLILDRLARTREGVDRLFRGLGLPLVLLLALGLGVDHWARAERRRPRPRCPRPLMGRRGPDALPRRRARIGGAALGLGAWA